MGRLKTNREKRAKQAVKNTLNKRRQTMSKQPTIAAGILPGVKPNDLKDVTCQACNEPQDKFIALAVLKHASRFQTTHGQPMLVNFPAGFACVKCGAVNKLDIAGVTNSDDKNTELPPEGVTEH